MTRRLLAFSLILATPWAVQADPFKPRLGYGAAPASRGVTVTWNSAADSATAVRIRPAAGGDWLIQEGASERWEPVGHYVHSVEIDGLTPWTEYVYQTGDGQQWGDEYTFRTAPENPCTPFRFVALGDERSQDDFGPDRNWAPILGEALADGPALVLNGGDLVKEGKEHDQWFNWLDMTDDLFAQVVHLPTIGNHDDDRVDGDGAHYNTLFTLPRNATTGTEDFWFSRFRDVGFVALSTATFDDDGFAAQAAWLDQVFTDNPTRWKVVFFHHPIYTAGREPLLHNPNEVGQNAALVPVLDAHHVDVVLQSHNHWYERFEPSAGGGGGDQPVPVANESEGTVYMTTGGAGAFTADLGDFLDLVCDGQVGCAVARGQHHYILFEADANRLTGTVKATAAQNFGESDDNREVIDLFALEKAGDERVDCAQFPPPGQEEREPAGGEDGAADGADDGAADAGVDGADDPGDDGGEDGGGGDGGGANEGGADLGDWDGGDGGAADAGGDDGAADAAGDGDAADGEAATGGDDGAEVGGAADGTIIDEPADDGGDPGQADGGPPDNPLADRREAPVGPGPQTTADSGCSCRQSLSARRLPWLWRR